MRAGADAGRGPAHAGLCLGLLGQIGQRLDFRIAFHQRRNGELEISETGSKFLIGS